jgi:hypothetical protein
MSAVDDILYAPIDTINPPVLDQALIANVALALGDPNHCISFSVNPSVSLDTYERIADIIEADNFVRRVASAAVAFDPFGMIRPTAALTIKDLFRFLHRGGKPAFYWTAIRSPAGIEPIIFANTFSIGSSLPLIRMADGRDYEWWIVGLMSQYVGYQGYYTFVEHNDATGYWKTP